MAIVSFLVLVSIDKKNQKKSFQCKRKFIKEQISLWKVIKFISEIEDEWERMIIYD